MEALIAMQEQKVVRYLGVTGHFRPDALVEALHRHDFDCILMALNAADPHHFTFQEQLLPLAVEKQMGIIGMKIPGRGRLLASWTPPSLEAQKHMWEGMVLGADAGHADDAGGDRVHAVPAGEHDYCWVRLDCAARGERADRAGFHAV